MARKYDWRDFPVYGVHIVEIEVSPLSKSLTLKFEVRERYCFYKSHSGKMLLIEGANVGFRELQHRILTILTLQFHKSLQFLQWNGDPWTNIFSPFRLKLHGSNWGSEIVFSSCQNLTFSKSKNRRCVVYSNKNLPPLLVGWSLPSHHENFYTAWISKRFEFDWHIFLWNISSWRRKLEPWLMSIP